MGLNPRYLPHDADATQIAMHEAEPWSSREDLSLTQNPLRDPLSLFRPLTQAAGEERPPSRDGPIRDTGLTDPELLHFPPLRRMGHRSIANAVSSTSSLRDEWRPAAEFNGLGDRDRSRSPSWTPDTPISNDETMLSLFMPVNDTQPSQMHDDSQSSRYTRPPYHERRRPMARWTGSAHNDQSALRSTWPPIPPLQIQTEESSLIASNPFAPFCDDYTSTDTDTETQIGQHDTSDFRVGTSVERSSRQADTLRNEVDRLGTHFRQFTDMYVAGERSNEEAKDALEVMGSMLSRIRQHFGLPNDAADHDQSRPAAERPMERL